MADEPTTPPDPATEPEGEPAGEPDLGDAGKAAIKAERTARAAAERENKELKKRLDKLEEANLNEVERAIKQARDEAASEAVATANKRIIQAEVKVAAGGKLSDPADAIRFLDLDQFTVDDDGNVDTDAISSAIDELVKGKPYLAADPAAGARPTPLPGGGARPPAQQHPINEALRAAAQRH